MSNRTPLEINHDYYANIDGDPEGFAEAILRYLRSGNPDDGRALLGFGVTVGRMRHHSEPEPFIPLNVEDAP